MNIEKIEEAVKNIAENRLDMDIESKYGWYNRHKIKNIKSDKDLRK